MVTFYLDRAIKKKKFRRLRFDKIVRIKRKMLHQLHV